MTEPTRRQRTRAVIRPSLSVLCGIDGRGALAAACLLPLRELADEIIVAFDARTDPQELGPVERVADRLVGYESAAPDRFHAWLREQASGDWLLWLDGDETVSEQLLRQIPALVEDRNVAGYLLPRRWAYRAAGMYLAGAPWDGDRRLRLVRNDGRLWFPAPPEPEVRCDPPTKHVSAPLLHLDLLINDETSRRARVLEGEAAGAEPGRSDRARVGRAFILPEESPSVTVAAHPEADALRVQKIMAGRHARGVPAGKVSISPADEVARWWPDRAVVESDYAARMRAISPPSALAGGIRVVLDVEVTNSGGHVWPATALDRSGHPLTVSYHWRHDDGAMAQWEGLRSPVPCRLAPGGSALAELRVSTPREPGAYRLCLDLVHEGVRWFGLDESVPISIGPPVPA
jgi:hypothetical protein